MAHAKGTTRLPPTRTRRWTVRSAWVPRVPCAPLIIAACLLSGLAGCRADRAQPAWRAQSEASCSECCGARCPPCGTYEPTVWSPWNSGPMAVRCGAGESCTEPDPDWLRDLPKPRPGGGVHTQPESIPAPPARSENSSRAAPGLGFELQRPASRPLVPSGAPPAAHSPNNAADSAGGGGAPAQWVGEGFQLQRPAAGAPRHCCRGRRRHLKARAEGTGIAARSPAAAADQWRRRSAYAPRAFAGTLRRRNEVSRPLGRYVLGRGTLGR